MKHQKYRIEGLVKRSALVLIALQWHVHKWSYRRIKVLDIYALVHYSVDPQASRIRRIILKWARGLHSFAICIINEAWTSGKISELVLEKRAVGKNHAGILIEMKSNYSYIYHVSGWNCVAFRRYSPQCAEGPITGHTRTFFCPHWAS